MPASSDLGVENDRECKSVLVLSLKQSARHRLNRGWLKNTFLIIDHFIFQIGIK